MEVKLQSKEDSNYNGPPAILVLNVLGLGGAKATDMTNASLTKQQFPIRCRPLSANCYHLVPSCPASCLCIHPAALLIILSLILLDKYTQ